MDNEIIQKDDIFTGMHENGRFEGFRFYADKNETTPQKTDEQSVIDDENLVITFAKRAARFCASSNGDFTLSSDGIVRWIGQPVGQLVATEDILNPKLILLADAQLTGEARSNVIARLERFITFHFETALKPLFDLRNADTLTGLTQSLAQQLVDSLGILSRRTIAEIIKNLDQESRAVLRRLGVRFGAFHIYLAAMLKPSPAQAITLLWRLKNEEQDQSGLSEILAALAAGRTSLVVDPTYNRKFYRLSGYRILGRRAVRIDILERLANLIRPALSWKPGIEPRPDGAYDGRNFFVTPTMMSILGANSTDMEEILKGLGYQSQPVSGAVFEKTIALNNSPSDGDTTTQTCPEAECVGPHWQVVKKPEATQKEKKSLAAEKHFRVTDSLPEAEPVGDFAEQKHAPTEDKITLLWCYQRQHNHHFHKNRDKFRQKEQNKKTFKKGAMSDNASRKGDAHTKYPHKYKKIRAERSDNPLSQVRKRPDPDSPFAKLAILRDQLKEDKDARAIPCNGR